MSVTPDRPITLTTETLPTGIERVSAYDNDARPTARIARIPGQRGADRRPGHRHRLDHPDLVASIDRVRKNCVTPGAPPNDGYGHGTHVAGTAAAPINRVGVVGAAPEAGLVAVKVFNDAGSSSEALVLCGFDHVMSLNADGDRRTTSTS